MTASYPYNSSLHVESQDTNRAVSPREIKGYSEPYTIVSFNTDTIYATHPQPSPTCTEFQSETEIETTTSTSETTTPLFQQNFICEQKRDWAISSIQENLKKMSDKLKGIDNRSHSSSHIQSIDLSTSSLTTTHSTTSPQEEQYRSFISNTSSLHTEPQNIITDASSYESEIYSGMHSLNHLDTSWMTDGNSELSPIYTENATIESEIESSVTNTSETITPSELTENSYFNIASIPSAIIYTVETPPITTSQDSETPPLASDSISQSPERPKKRAKQTTPFSEEIIKHLIILIEHQLKTFGSISWTMVATHINRDLKPKIPITKCRISNWYNKKYLPSLHSKD